MAVRLRVLPRVGPVGLQYLELVDDRCLIAQKVQTPVDAIVGWKPAAGRHGQRRPVRTPAPKNAPRQGVELIAFVAVVIARINLSNVSRTGATEAGGVGLCTRKV